MTKEEQLINAIAAAAVAVTSDNEEEIAATSNALERTIEEVGTETVRAVVKRDRSNIEELAKSGLSLLKAFKAFAELVQNLR